MIEETIIQSALSSTEASNGTKSKFKALTESIENAAQISGQDTLHIAFSKMTGSALSSANRLKAGSPNLMWMDLKKELPMQYSVILFDSHTTQAFAPLEQGPDELLDVMSICTVQVSFFKNLVYFRYV